MAREWGKVAFNPDAICYTSVSQGGKCDVVIWVWHEKNAIWHETPCKKSPPDTVLGEDLHRQRRN